MARRTKHKPYRSKKSVANLPTGIIRINSQGFGFVDTSEGSFFIPSEKTNGAMDGDTVRLRKRNSGQYKHRPSEKYNPVAYVDRVLERAHQTLVGFYSIVEGKGFVVPQDVRLDYMVRAYVGKNICPEQGDIVIARMQTYPSKYESPSAIIEKIIGRPEDKRILEEIIAARHGIETKFSETVLNEVNQCELNIQKALEEPDRKDIRERFVMTIDPSDAKDFDDALSLDYVDGNLRLGVHIADVSSYVLCDSSLDLCARSRATSTYFPGMVIPMLPEKLSNDLCSLNPHEDRLAFTIDIFLDKNAVVDHAEIYPSIIRSKMRLDYESVQKMFDGKNPYPDEKSEQVLFDLKKVSRNLFKKRLARGALEFCSCELKIELDEEGNPKTLRKRNKSEATDLVEEAMILANEIVAKTMLEAKAKMVYRVHDKPTPEKIEAITPIVRTLGYEGQKIAPTNKGIQKVLSAVQNKPNMELVHSILLRAMKQAI